MPKCPKCHKNVSVMNLDLFGGGCSACLGVDASSYTGILDKPCDRCGGNALWATAAPALAFVRTQVGNVPTKTATGLFIVGCATCGAAVWRFSDEGRKALPEAAGWIGRDQLESGASG